MITSELVFPLIARIFNSFLYITPM